MAPYEILERVDNVRNLVSERPRISVTELSRNKDWRDQLPKAGVIEVTDRGETAGWLLSSEDMNAIIEACAYLEEQVERAQISAIFGVRKDSKPLTGKPLQSAVLEAYEARKDELRGIVDAD